MRVLKMNLFRAPPVGHLVQNDLGDLDSCAADPGYPVGVEFNLRGEDSGHGSLLAPVYAGAVIGVGSIIAGLDGAITNILKSFGPNTIVVLRGSGFGGFTLEEQKRKML